MRPRYSDYDEKSVAFGIVLLHEEHMSKRKIWRIVRFGAREAFEQMFM